MSPDRRLDPDQLPGVFFLVKVRGPRYINECIKIHTAHAAFTYTANGVRI